MNSITLLTKDTYEVIQEKVFTKANSSKDAMLSTPSVLELVKDIDCLSVSEFFTIKLENKVLIYRKSKESKLSILIQCDKGKFKSTDLTDISRSILTILEKNYFSESLNKNHVIDLNIKELIFSSIEELTVNFLELLRKNKLFAKFVYFNYNPSVANAFTYKKIKQESASVILYNHKENEKLTEVKDTILQKSTIKEKELCIELDKKSFQPCDRKIQTKKFHGLKPDLFKKKNLIKYYSGSTFIEKYVRSFLIINISF